MTQLRKHFVGYLLATHGVRKLSFDHPAIRQQIANLKAWEAANDGKASIDFRSDYARRIGGLGDLPNLQDLLEEGSSVMLDDLSRLFRPCGSVQAAKELYLELEPHAENIIGIRQKMNLGGLSSRAVSTLVSRQLNPRFVIVGNAPKRKRRSSEDRQTEAANAASAKSRGKAADEAAQPLKRLKSTLEAGGQTVTLAKLAERANADGLRTTRGNLWRADTVSRALKRTSP
ncbi:hypothetical protein LR948_13645 [Roseivivax sp. GX 12232]|uniref:hypothetical protein n=1 Tax=Roseivivax sp. GX 12232 TaxID=2900547 RepID=UPI001E3D524C|nr:hypothetical protein [Roseivivax sp. GX 12232]MCE0506409.1 hypothetical protein [Roseivivax sp. GX 12232]